jgi:hypothetical protein
VIQHRRLAATPLSSRWDSRDGDKCRQPVGYSFTRELLEDALIAEQRVTLLSGLSLPPVSALV